MEKRPDNYRRPTEESLFSNESTQTPQPSRSYRQDGTDQKKLIMILSVVAGILAIAFVAIFISKNRLVKDLNAEKADLTEQIVALQQDYAGLSSDYETINAQLDSSREEVNQLVERIQKTEATNRAKIRQYEKELGTLRSIMRNYIVQIDSLNTLNHKLTADAAAARREAANVKKKNADLQKTVDDLSGKVETGSIVRARGIKAEAYNAGGKVIDRAAKVTRVLVSLTLNENSLAQAGPVRVYIAVYNPDGQLLTNSESRSCPTADGSVPTSASREIDYQGEDVDLSIYLNDIPSYSKGIYTVNVMTDRASLGSTQFMLR